MVTADIADGRDAVGNVQAKRRRPRLGRVRMHLEQPRDQVLAPAIDDTRTPRDGQSNPHGVNRMVSDDHRGTCDRCAAVHVYHGDVFDNQHVLLGLPDTRHNDDDEQRQRDAPTVQRRLPPAASGGARR